MWVGFATMDQFHNNKSNTCGECFEKYGLGSGEINGFMFNSYQNNKIVFLIVNFGKKKWDVLFG